MMIKKLVVVFGICLFGASAISAENLLTNGGFEIKGKGPKDLPGYSRIHPSRHPFFELDTEVKHSGERSLRIFNVEKTWIAFIPKSIPLSEFNKPLMIRGWAKYSGLVEKAADGRRCGMPFIGIWATTQAGRNSTNIPIPIFAEGSKDWFYFEQLFTPEEFRKRSAHLTGDKAPKNITFRINVSNQPGTVWFDDLEFFWVEPKALVATLPLRDVTGNQLRLELVAGEKVTAGKLAISIDGKVVLASHPVTAGKSQVVVPLTGIADGKHTLEVRPVEGFPEGTDGVKLEFTRQPDAFAE